MQMREGLIVSGTVHGLFVLWALVGAWLQPSPPEVPFAVTEVSVMTNAEFDALVSDAPSAQAPTPPAPVSPTFETPEITTPQIEITPRPVTPTPQPAPEAPPPPDVAILTPPPRTEVQPETPQAPEPPAPPPSDPDAPISDAPPTPRAAPRVAPTPAPPSLAETAPVVEAAPTPSEQSDAPPEEAAPEPVAPPEATTRIVTEADIPSRAPEVSLRPQRKPSRPVAVAETPVVEAPVDEAPLEEAEQAPTPEPDTSSGIAGAIAELQQSPAAAPSGPPLSGGERDGFRVAVQTCWNVDPGAVWAQTAVTIAFALNPDGTPVASSLRMAGFQGGSEATARQAFEAGRRAILRCGARGFDLPQEKYDHWQEVEMTFDPSSMRIR